MIDDPFNTEDFPEAVFDEGEADPPRLLSPEQFEKLQVQRRIEREAEGARVVKLNALVFALQSLGPMATTEDIVDRAEAFRIFLSPTRSH